MKIVYIWKHKNDKDIQTKNFTIEEIENGEAKIYNESMKKDGYILIDREFI